MIVRSLYLSPGHNYFGRHGQEPGAHPVHEVEEMECVAGHGIRGDRFFDYKPDYKGQITFFSGEVFAEVCRTLATGPRSPGVTRRNVITEGVDLNTLIGRRFTIQGIEFEGRVRVQSVLLDGSRHCARSRGGAQRPRRFACADSYQRRASRRAVIYARLPSRAAHRHAVELDGGNSHAHGHALPIFAADADPLVELQVVARPSRRASAPPGRCRSGWHRAPAP